MNYAATVSITSYQAMGWLRTAVGIALIVAPGAPMRLAGPQEPTGADMLLMRTIGIRDLVLGLGTVAAARLRSKPCKGSAGQFADRVSRTDSS